MHTRRGLRALVTGMMPLAALGFPSRGKTMRRGRIRAAALVGAGHRLPGIRRRAARRQVREVRRRRIRHRHLAQRRPGTEVRRGSRQVPAHAGTRAGQARHEERFPDHHRDHRSNSDWKTWLQPRENVAGFFQRARFANYLAMNGDAPPAEALALVFHEYTPLLSRVTVRGRIPALVQRRTGRAHGLRQVRQGQGDPADSNGPLLRGARRRLDSLRSPDPRRSDRSRIPVAPAGGPRSTRNPGSPCTTAWSRTATSAGRSSVLSELNTLVPQEEAARNAFGDLASTNKLLRDYSRQSKHPSGAMDSWSRCRGHAADRHSRSSEMDTLAILADVMLDSRLPPGRIRPLVESLERRDTNKARAAILAARVAHADEDHSALRSGGEPRRSRARSRRLGAAPRARQRVAGQRTAKVAR